MTSCCKFKYKIGLIRVGSLLVKLTEINYILGIIISKLYLGISQFLNIIISVKYDDCRCYISEHIAIH